VSLSEPGHRTVLSLITQLRRAGIAADLAFGQRGLKGAMKAASRSGARYAILVGDRELEQRSVQIKDLGLGDQREVAADAAVAWLTERLASRMEPSRMEQGR
jgi:histidyl-tRNA synthetase